MSDFLNLQAALGQTSILSGLSGANAQGMGSDGGFGAVLGAVMADSMGGSVAAELSVGASVDASRAQVTADGNAGNTKVGDDAVSEGAAAAALEADKAAKALAELYGALGSLEGSDEALPDVMFTSEGAKAFISVLERYISQGNVPAKDIEELWKGVQTEEKDAYADILGAIALGSVVLPDENDEMFEVSSEDMLGFVLKEAGKLAARPMASKKSDKDEEEAASYIMSVFFAPSFSVGMETENDGETIAEGGFAEAVSGDIPFAAAEDTEAVRNAAGSAENAVNADNADSEQLSAADTESALSMSELGEAMAETVLDADSDFAEKLEEFCGELAKELKAEAAGDMANAEKAFAVTPEDIGRQAFMARVSAPVQEASVVGVEAALRQNTADNADEVGLLNEEIDGTAKGEFAASVANAENYGSSENAAGKAASEDDREAQINAFEGAVQNAAAVGSKVFETEETAYAEDVPVSPADTAEIARRISEHISKGRNESITLRLDPEDLGEIKITVSRKAGETIVAFEAHKSESAELIGDRAAALAEALAAKGIAVREISVTDMNSDRNGNNAGGSRSGGEFYGGNRQADPDSSAGNGNAQRNGYSRHYYFEEPEETPTADENYYYNKEANLWLSV